MIRIDCNETNDSDGQRCHGSFDCGKRRVDTRITSREVVTHAPGRAFVLVRRECIRKRTSAQVRWRRIYL